MEDIKRELAKYADILEGTVEPRSVLTERVEAKSEPVNETIVGGYAATAIPSVFVLDEYCTKHGVSRGVALVEFTEMISEGRDLDEYRKPTVSSKLARSVTKTVIEEMKKLGERNNG